jgi:uncharacterized protein (DUF427 family)
MKAGHVEPAPRRVRGIIGTEAVFDTIRALYVWEWPHYPQYYIPRADVRMDLLRTAGDPRESAHGEAQYYDIAHRLTVRKLAARGVLRPAVAELADHVRFTWAALDHWLEEDEEVFVHPRDPYTRVDALRSLRKVRIELAGTVLAESSSPVMLFETGLPARYYLDRSDVRFEHLTESATRTACPYKGRTTSYWSASVGATTLEDVAWSYAFPTREMLPIAGLIAFLNERIDVFIDGVEQARPVTHMS